MSKLGFERPVDKQEESVSGRFPTSLAEGVSLMLPVSFTSYMNLGRGLDTLHLNCRSSPMSVTLTPNVSATL